MPRCHMTPKKVLLQLSPIATTEVPSLVHVQSVLLFSLFITRTATMIYSPRHHTTHPGCHIFPHPHTCTRRRDSIFLFYFLVFFSPPTSHTLNPIHLSPLSSSNQVRALGGVRVGGAGAKGRTSGGVAVMASVVTIEHEGKSYDVEVDGHESILEAAIDAGIENLSYDCMMVRRGAAEEVEGGGLLGTYSTYDVLDSVFFPLLDLETPNTHEHSRVHWANTSLSLSLYLSLSLSLSLSLHLLIVCVWTRSLFGRLPPVVEFFGFEFLVSGTHARRALSAGRVHDVPQ